MDKVEDHREEAERDRDREKETERQRECANRHRNQQVSAGQRGRLGAGQRNRPNMALKESHSKDLEGERGVSV